MTKSTFSENEINEIWDQLDREANENKNSHEALIRLKQVYDGWGNESQRKARRIFGQWLDSDNPRKRFDAISLIDQLSIVEVADDLKKHQESLKSRSGPEAKNELDRVTLILARLEK